MKNVNVNFKPDEFGPENKHVATRDDCDYDDEPIDRYRKNAYGLFKAL